jgi:hypothetical protein
MAKVEVIKGGQKVENVIVATPQPMSPTGALPPDIGYVEISVSDDRGSIWMTGQGPPTQDAGQTGDMYLDMDTGDVYQWNGTTWVLQGTFAPSTDTPAEILAKLITVDGAGSLLDADTLDGHDSTYFATDSDMNIAETNIVTLQVDVDAVEASNALKANIASPTFTGDPKAPTPSVGDNDTSVATTAFVTQAVGAVTVDAYTKAQADTKFVDVTGDTMTGTLWSYTGVDGAKQFFVSGLTKGIRFGFAPTYSTIEGVDATGTGSYQPLMIGGGGSSNSVSFGAAVDMPNGATSVTPPPGDNDTSVATTAFVKTALSSIVGGAIVSDTAPASPQVGQLWFESDSGNTFIWYADADSSQWVQVNIQPAIASNPNAGLTAQTRSRICNGAMQISQELGDTNTATFGAYPADQWSMSGATIATASAAHFSNRLTPSGNKYVVAASVSTGKPSLAAGDYLAIEQRIEGIRLVDARYGSATAAQMVLRFAVHAQAAGTYCVGVRNSAGNRSGIFEYVISGAEASSGYAIKTVVIPGDTTGTWLNDTGIGLILTFTIAAGTTFQGVTGWQTGTKLATANQVNAVAVANTYFHISDVGLYLDPLNTGLAPRWEMPDEAAELAACQRYWESGNSGMDGSTTIAGQYVSYRHGFKAIKRVNPALSGTATGSNTGQPFIGDSATVAGFRPLKQVTGAGGFAWSETFTANARM